MKLDNDLWLMKIKDYKYIYWFTGIGCLVVIFSFLMKRKWWDDNLCFQKWKIEVIDKENIYIAAVYIYICNC